MVRPPPFFSRARWPPLIRVVLRFRSSGADRSSAVAAGYAGRRDHAHVAQAADLLHRANVAVPESRATTIRHDDAAQIAAADGLGPRPRGLGQLTGPVQTVRAVLDRQRPGVAAERHAGVIDASRRGRRGRGAQAAGGHDLAPAAEVAALDAERDRAVQRAAFDAQLTGCGALLHRSRLEASRRLRSPPRPLSLMGLTVSHRPHRS